MDDLDQMLDALVLAEIRGGNHHAYGILIDRYQVRLRSCLSAYLQLSNELDAITQQTFVRAFAMLDQHDHSQAFFSWLCSIALNEIRQKASAYSTGNALGSDCLRQVLLERALDANLDNQGDVPLGVLDQCLIALPAEVIALLSDKYQSDYTIAEIAARHRTSDSALKAKLLHLRDRLAACCERRSIAEHT